MGKIKWSTDGYWSHMDNTSAKENEKAVMREVKRGMFGTVGKYLFFSNDREALIELAEKVLIKYNLWTARVPHSHTPFNRRNETDEGFSFVLEIYDSEPKLKNELKQYADEKKIKYRYWKNDADTLKEKYLKEFMKSSKR